MAYKAPVRDLSFVLNEVLEVERYANHLEGADLSRELIDQVLEEGGKFAEEVIAPINRVGDQHGCKIEGDVVTTLPSILQPSLSPGLLIGAITSSANRPASSSTCWARSDDTS